MKLSIIIVEYKSEDEVRKCVDAITSGLGQDCEVIVSSNSCYGAERRRSISSRYNDATWVFNDRNGGFAYAMNRGLERASGDVLVAMNSDCCIGPDIMQMAGFLAQHPDVGAIAPKMVDGRGHTQDTAREYVTLPRILWRQAKRVFSRDASILERHMDYGRVQTVDWVIGAFIMLTRKAYELTGGFDERFFMYAEDTDLCTRIRQNGLEVVYYPKVCITYKGTRRARHNLKYARIFLSSHLAYWRKFGFVWGYPRRKEIFY